MRGAGCTWNDITDRDFDGAVARTRSRPIPSGAVSVRQAAVWLVLQALVAFAILLTFHPTAIWLGIGSLALVAVYPFAKRFTWWPQVFLGLAFNWGALLGWAAVTGSLSAAPLALYAGGIAWTLFYDTIYAHQDKEDDALIGVKSTARLFGANTRPWLRGFLVATVLLFGLAVILALGPTGNLLRLALGIGAAWGLGWHLAWQLARLDTEDPANCLRLFRVEPRRRADPGRLPCNCHGRLNAKAPPQRPRPRPVRRRLPRGRALGRRLGRAALARRGGGSARRRRPGLGRVPRPTGCASSSPASPRTSPRAFARSRSRARSSTARVWSTPCRSPRPRQSPRPPTRSRCCATTPTSR